MGSKTPIKDNEKQSWTCEVCERDFLTRQALRSHAIAKHKSSPKSITKKETTKKKKNLSDVEKAPTSENKKVVTENIPASRVSRRLQLKKDRTVEMKDNSSKADTTPVKATNESKNSNIRTEFECPLCDKVFSVYFSASKHIEKKHNLTNEDETNPEVMKPIRVEKCSTCSVIIGDEPHSCNDQKPSSAYRCLGCQKIFSKLDLFNKHTISNHSADADLMSFRGIHDFSTWKVNMEAQVKVKYSIFDKQAKEQHHQCNFVSPKNQMNITYLCPSIIITKQLTDKIEIQYYKRHYGHTTPQYQLLDEYKKNIIDKKDGTQSITTENVYQKFKTLMQSIIIDASKTKLDNLKKLLAMAIKMQSYLDDGDDEIPFASKSMTDDQIIDELEGIRNVTTKRRAVTPDNIIKKRSKVDGSFTLASPAQRSPPSFNDSYKQFIDLTKAENKRNAKKEVVKTKIGQFVPSPKKISPKNDNEKKKPNILRPNKNNASPLGNAKIKDVKYEVREQENDCNILVLKI